MKIIEMGYKPNQEKKAFLSENILQPGKRTTGTFIKRKMVIF
jgi:hypothetical protein